MFCVAASISRSFDSSLCRVMFCSVLSVVPRRGCRPTNPMASLLHSASKSADGKADAFAPAVIVGIDVGTARSGYSFALAHAKAFKEIVCEQSGANLKQLTAVLLRADLSFVAFGENARKEYLESDPAKQHDLLYFERFKMCLYGDDIKERPVIQAANGKTANSVDVFAAALGYFKTHALKRINESSSNGLRVTESEVQWVVTVPAVWSPGAKQLMREAAKKAGLWDKIESQLVLALESEAASLCCRERELQINAAQWKPDMRYLVMDLGGGTADFTVHKVTDTHALGEVIASSGGAWGSVFIETEFMRLLEQIFGEKLMKTWRITFPLDSVELLADFEALKHGVTTTDFKPKRIRLPLSLLSYVQQQTGKNVESLCANYAARQPNSPSAEASATVKPTASAGVGAADTKDDAKRGKGLSDSKSSVASGTQSLLAHIVPTYGGGGAANADAPVAGAAAAAGNNNPPPKKLLDEWVFVGTEMPSVPGGVGSGVAASDACVSYSRGQLKLSADLIASLFEPVVSKIVAHMHEVLAKAGAISHIFMAGGFSESDIVKAAVQTAISPRGIRIVIPPHSALAVLTGAVLFGLKPKLVASRIVKRTYGVAVSCEWQPKKHGDRKKAFRPNNGKMVAFCDGIFSPFCLAGDELKVDFAVSQVYTPGEDNQECMVLKIYQSNNRNVTYIDAPDASLAAQMTLAMPDMTGNLQRKVQVTMSFGATEILVTALDQTSGVDSQVKLSFLDRGFDGSAKVTASA